MSALQKAAILTSLLVLLAGPDAHAVITGLTRVASGLSGPMYVTAAPGDPTRLFIAERGGAIKILNLTTGAVEPTPFLSIPSVDQAGEGGLLGLAFHPDYQTNHKFYVNVTIDNGGQVFQGATSPFSTEIRQYTVSANPNIANSSPTPILSFLQPQSNHNGGWIGFSPINNLLYIPTGDGGGGNDDGAGHTPAGTGETGGNAQDITDNLLGKILRIDVNSDDFPADTSRNYHIPAGNPYAGVTTGDDEIWARGMRNPFRDSFDRLTGDLWLGDVGQDNREEIDRQPANAPSGENFGWRLREGNIQTPTVGGAIPANYRAPVYDYARPTGNATTDLYRGSVVSGGYVYRGPDPALQGKYFFLDSRNTSGTSDDNYWYFDSANPTGTVANINSQLTANTGSHQFPVSFGEDTFGNLYIAYLTSGEIYRITTTHPQGDYNFDGHVDNTDYDIWRATLGLVSNTAPADGNGSGTVDVADYVIWRKNSGASVGAGAGSSTGVPEAGTAFYLTQLLTIGPSLLRRRKRSIIGFTEG
jgi:glucose/arabinose dehydrogenase